MSLLDYSDGDIYMHIFTMLTYAGARRFITTLKACLISEMRYKPMTFIDD